MGSNTDTAPTGADTAAFPTTAIKYARQAEKLSLASSGEDIDGANTAVHAHFVTPQDPIIVTGDGGRLPGVPLAEAEKLNLLKAVVEGDSAETLQAGLFPEKSESDNGSRPDSPPDGRIQKSGEGSLRRAMPPSRTNPLFPPLPLYGPPSIVRDLQCLIFRVSAFFLSGCFLGIIVLGAAFTSLQPMFVHIWIRLKFRNPDARRPFHEEEKRLKRVRNNEDKAWTKKQQARRSSTTKLEDDTEGGHEEFIPTEGGPDPLICDVAYYARRVGLDMETFKVQTEDGFIIELWHIYNPLEFTPLSDAERAARGPDIFTGAGPSRPSQTQKPKFPILMMHGLLQSSGAYCTNDDRSLAFYLCKSGYDVWLGNNRCGFHPDHTLLSTSDPRMWAWNIRQMGVMDLPALTSRVLSETGFEKLGLIARMAWEQSLRLSPRSYSPVYLRPQNVGLEHPSNGSNGPTRAHIPCPLRNRLRKARSNRPFSRNDSNSRRPRKRATSRFRRETHRFLRARPSRICRSIDRQSLLQIHAPHLPRLLPHNLRHPRLHPHHDDHAPHHPRQALRRHGLRCLPLPLQLERRAMGSRPSRSLLPVRACVRLC